MKDRLSPIIWWSSSMTFGTLIFNIITSFNNGTVNLIIVIIMILSAITMLTGIFLDIKWDYLRALQNHNSMIPHQFKEKE